MKLGRRNVGAQDSWLKWTAKDEWPSQSENPILVSWSGQKPAYHRPPPNDLDKEAATTVRRCSAVTSRA